MNTIKILTDEDFQLQSIPFDNPRIRYGVRGILLNDNDTIAVQIVMSINFLEVESMKEKLQKKHLSEKV